jgi:hypothetical protein
VPTLEELRQALRAAEKKAAKEEAPEEASIGLGSDSELSKLFVKGARSKEEILGEAPPLPPWAAASKSAREYDVRYKIAADGKDVLFQFGRHRGKTAKQIAASDDRDYLNWLLKQDFPAELKDVIRYVLKALAVSNRVKDLREAAGRKRREKTPEGKRIAEELERRATEMEEALKDG